ncbi:hypothetical protein [Salinispora tropica]|uniref:Uncharacterized protein n=1 Tax=Salinispora tropica (strain ATCC BAA-916 / DSM 44818 / JCM 13857 / NBRC 105044 / CNB-440) TaxID=369723 RepID=A4X111_SALTO|nr:hypothetical protein [Salinispora tropica]ABP52561.1 hypothetical protein Strop_0076 [Salinispora tropica CNB-440]
MSGDLDQRLATMLQHQAGGDVDPTPIVRHARHRGRRLRLRRRGLVAAGAAAACAALAVVVMVAPLGRTPVAAPVTPIALVLPDAPGQPGAVARPDLVGTDPGVMHFVTDALVHGAVSATWTAGRGVESVELRGPNGQARLMLARSTEMLDEQQQTLGSEGRPRQHSDVRVEGHPGVAWFDAAGDRQLWFVRWQPADGLWAQLDIYAAGRDEATAAAGRVRFDGAQRCVVPFRLQTLPSGGRLLACSVTLGRSEHGVFTSGSLVVGDGSGRWLTVRAQLAPDYEAKAGDLVAGPYRARRQGGDVLEMGVGPCVVEAFLEGWGRGYTESDGLTVLGGYQPAHDLGRPAMW